MFLIECHLQNVQFFFCKWSQKSTVLRKMAKFNVSQKLALDNVPLDFLNLVVEK